MTTRLRLSHLGLILLLLPVQPLSAGAGRWTPFGPDAGGLRALAADPHDADLLLGVIPWGGYGTDSRVVRSTNGGASWQDANHGLEGKRIVALAFDPLDSSRLYALAATQGCFTLGPGGVYGSEDTGQHWQLLATDDELGGLACHTTLTVAAGKVLVGARSGIAWSADQGASWNLVQLTSTEDGIDTVASSPANAQTIFAAGRGGQFKSVDGGVHWSALGPSAQPLQTLSLAVAPSDGQSVYLYGPFGIVRSRDAGITWDLPLPGAPGGGGLSGGPLTVDAHDPDTLYLGTSDGFFISRDGGVHFHPAYQKLPGLTHARYFGTTALILDAQDRILLATPTGLFRSDDAGFQWAPLPNLGLHQNPVDILRLDPFDSRRILMSSFDRLYFSRNGGATFLPAGDLPSGYLYDVAFDAIAPGRVLAVLGTTYSASPRVWTSSDGGAHWQLAITPPPGTRGIAEAGAASLGAVAGDRIFHSVDGGATWKRVAQGFPMDDRGYFLFNGVSIHPQDPTVWFATGFDNQLHGVSEPVLFLSRDSGAHWVRWAEFTRAFAIDASHPQFVYTARGADIFRQKIGSPQANKIATLEPNVPISALVIDRRSPSVFYAATAQLGIYMSADRGATWTSLSAGLPLSGELPVNALEQDRQNPNRLYSTPSTGGLWRYDLPAN